MASRTPPPIPAALRKPAGAHAAPRLLEPEVAEDGYADLHVLIVVPNPKMYAAIEKNVFIVGPQYAKVRIHGHVVLDDPHHRSAGLGYRIRMALAELGLVDPSQVGFTPAEQVTLGWQETPE